MAEPSGFLLNSDLYTGAIYSAISALENYGNKQNIKSLGMDTLMIVAYSGVARFLQRHNYGDMNALLNMWDDQYTYIFLICLSYKLWMRKKGIKAAMNDSFLAATSAYIGDYFAEHQGGGQKVIF